MYLCVLNAQQVYNMHTCKPICKKHHGRRVPLHWEAILCLCLPVPIILTFMFVENIFFSIYDLISSKTQHLYTTQEFDREGFQPVVHNEYLVEQAMWRQAVEKIFRAYLEF